MNCVVCSGKKGDHWNLCSDHHLAFDRIVKAFEAWNKSYGGLPTRKYLKEILRRPETGRLAIEVTEFLLQDEEHMSLWEDKFQGA